MASLASTRLLNLLQYRVKMSGSSPMFKRPTSLNSHPPEGWTDITFAEFAVDVDSVAVFLATELKEKDVPPRSVVSIWFSGFEYDHLVYIIAISRLSYTPQMFSLYLTDFAVILELMEQAGSKAIIYDPSLEPSVVTCPLPRVATIPVGVCPKANPVSMLPRIGELSFGDQEHCFIYLTSGSTSGRPKLVPYTHRFIKRALEKFSAACFQGGPFESQDVTVQYGSFCHISTMLRFLGSLYLGFCMIQPSELRYSPREIMNMVNVCGLNRYHHFGSALSEHIKAARGDPMFLKALQTMRTVSYSGVSLKIEDDEWCHQNSIPLVNSYANTECSFLMSSILGERSRFLRPLPGLSYKFDAIGQTTQPESAACTPLLELVILADSPELPPQHLRSADGNFHTADLFEEQRDGSYLFRGRGDDWLINDDVDWCDTRAIEDRVYEACGDLIKGCVVVGNGRASPALFVEVMSCSSAVSAVSADCLKEMILERIKESNSRRWMHEQITKRELILVVDEGTLPRTAKGNFRRRAIEQQFLTELDAAYASVLGC